MKSKSIYSANFIGADSQLIYNFNFATMAIAKAIGFLFSFFLYKE